ncbi:MAG: hypothetical protein AABW59_03510 [archaeon]
MEFNVEKTLNEDQLALVLVPSADYNDFVVQIAGDLHKKKVCYITLNKTVDSLREIFAKKKIDTSSFTFVDAISRTIKEGPEQGKGVYYINSPSALTELSIIVHKLLEKKFDYLVFDSLSNLTVYQKKETIVKFISLLANRIKATKTKSIIYAVKINDDEAAIQQSSMYVDKVIDLSK